MVAPGKTATPRCDRPPRPAQLRIGWLPVWSGALSLVMIQAMHGSAWPTGGFFLVGAVLPIPLLWAIWPMGVRRFNRSLALAISLSLLGGTAWIGKHPSPATAFRDVTSVALPSSVQVIKVERSWNDGRVSIMYFRDDPQAVRKLMTLVDEQLAPSSTQRVIDDDLRNQGLPYEHKWSMAVVWAVPISPGIAQPPAWEKPRMSHWMLPFSGSDRGVWFLWDDTTGEAIVYDGSD